MVTIKDLKTIVNRIPEEANDGNIKITVTYPYKKLEERFEHFDVMDIAFLKRCNIPDDETNPMVMISCFPNDPDQRKFYIEAGVIKE